jgi:hypothetical protein
LKELLSDRLVEILIANPSKLHFVQEVLHGDLQRLNYDLCYVHTPYPKLNCIALFVPLKQISANLHNFFVDLHACRISHGEQILFLGAMSNSTPINSDKLLT